MHHRPAGAASGNRLGDLLAAWAAWAADHRLLVIAATLLLAALPAAFLPRLQFNNTPDAFFLDGDRTVETYRAFRKRFANDEFTLITLRVPPGREGEAIDAARALAERLAALPDVVEVRAITNVRHVDGSGDSIDVGEHIPPELPRAEQARRLLQARAHPYYGGLYVSRDGRHLGIVVETDAAASAVADKHALTQAVRALVAEPGFAALDARAIGAPIIDADTYSIVSTETGAFGAAVFALVAVGFLLAFRSMLGLVLPLAVALLAVLFSFGFMGLIGGEIGMLTPMIPSFLISVGIGSAIFLIDEYLQQRDAGRDAREAMIDAMRTSGGAAVLAVATTSAALLAFSTSKVKPVQEVGVVMGVGLLAALAFTLLLFPLLAPLAKRRRGAGGAPLLKRFLARLFDRVAAAPGAVVLAFCALGLVGIVGMAQLKVDYFYLGTFKESTRIRQDYAAANAAIPASNSIEVVVDGARADFFKDPRALKALDGLADWAGGYRGAAVKPYSVADVVQELHEAYVGRGPAGYAIPESREAVSQLLLLFESSGDDELRSLVSPDLSQARLMLLVPTRPYSAYDGLVAGIESQAAARFAAAGLGPVQVEVTGVVPLWMRISDYLLENQIQSFAISALVVAVVMVFVARSLLLGLVLALTNALVVVMALGAMGWMGILLDPFTILVGAIALGILDDDTIHFIRLVLDRIAQGASPPEAIRSAYLTAGHAVLIMTAVLVASFSIYAFSSVASLSNFGLVVSGTIILGLVTEYLLTPAALLLIARRAAPAVFRPQPA